MSEYNIQMNKYNALNADYDQLYPATKIENVDGLDTALQNKADASSVYTKEESISAETRTALSLPETATPDAALAEIARQLSESKGVQITKVWENASPSSSFSAQAISKDLSSYNSVLIISSYDTGSSAISMIPCRVGKSCYLSACLTYSDGYILICRRVDVTATEITFRQSECVQNGTFTADYVERNIPLVVYGITGIA